MYRTDSQDWVPVDLSLTGPNTWGASVVLLPGTSSVEYFVQVVDAAGNVAVSSGKARYDFSGNPTPPVRGEISVSDVSVTEGSGPGTTTATVTAYLARAANRHGHRRRCGIRLHLRLDPDDFSGGIGTLSFAPGEVVKTFTVTIVRDTEAEPPESIAVELRNPVDGDLVDGTGEIVILDDDVAVVDVPPTVDVDPVTAAEGTAATPTDLSFPVRLSTPAPTDVVLSWHTVAGTAVAPGDFTAVAAGTLTIPAGATGGTIVVSVSADSLFEADESFTVVLDSVTGGLLGTSVSAAATVTNDDAAPTVSVDDVAALEGAVGSTPFSFPVRLSAVSGLPSVVTWGTVAGTAVSPADFTVVAAGSLTIPAGATSGTAGRERGR